MKYKNATGQISLDQCIKLHEILGIDFIIEDGKDVTFEVQKTEK
ncbi:hypothetical protein [Clostridium scatologenes]|uniref:Uncharacterized protein n=1 Tax=Clostridium scatologenes TaxID=1548 RepID=A0A0E3M5J1_CLOSL|nr:hypothetical protein [Clostridium scatologenes]AKA68503.1 hypothetical protein CSCA_1378 [Clostridium scatologenes]